MTKQDAEAFARAWVAAWNDRDLDAILRHYDERIVFRSPRIADVMGEQDGLVEGKDALRTYWTAALSLAPKLYFELDQVFTGSNALTLLYTNHRDQRVTETFVFGNAGKVVLAIAAYA